MGNSGTLRYVIGQLNQSNDPSNSITFSIGSGHQTITLKGSPLPAIIKPVLIDGTTQSGFDLTNPVPLIQIDGQSNIIGDGLTLAAGSSGSTIRGLCIGGFDAGAGIHIVSSNNLIQGNFLGITAAGTGNANLVGVEIEGGGNNTIGGSTSGASNRISDNFGNGIEITGSNATSNLVQGNVIIGNSGDGVLIGGDDPQQNTIGGTTSGASNTIFGNFGNGVEISGSKAASNLVQGNVIIGNSGDGVLIGGDDPQQNTIGGTTSGATNTIFGNFGNGVEIACGGQSNQVQGNQVNTF